MFGNGAQAGRQRLLMLNEASRGIGRTLDVIGTAQELARTPVPGFVDLVTAARPAGARA